MFKIIDHPLIRSKLTRMRNAETNTRDFRLNLQELAQFMAYEITKNYPTETFKVQTPVGIADGYRLKDKIVLVPILRAGLGMVDGFKSMLSAAPIGHIGMYRNEKTLEPVEYYCKMPDCIGEANVIILDPMLATGNSAVDAVNALRKFQPKSIKFASIVSAPEGVKNLTEKCPDIEIFTCALDEKLNEHGYIVPGLGDAGDRIFGTK